MKINYKYYIQVIGEIIKWIQLYYVIIYTFSRFVYGYTITQTTIIIINLIDYVYYDSNT